MDRDQLSVASICMRTQGNKKENIAQALAQVKAAAKAGAQWILLPEMFAFMGSYAEHWKQAEDEKGELNRTLSELAQSLQITLIAGSVGERPHESELLPPKSAEKIYNTLYMFDPQGACIAKYRKCHLFALNDAKNQPLYLESEGILAGAKPVTAVHEGWRLGFAICYDLRFPSFFQLLNQEQPIDLLIIPAAFTAATGKDHWLLLLQARAVELQCYVLAANQTGVHAPGKVSFGHSLVIDPWGKVLADTGAEAGIALAKLSKESLEAYRQRLPALANQRRDLYGSS